MAHTPGPWAVREPDPDERAADLAEGREPEDMEMTEVYADEDGEQVCFVMNTTPNEAANARLIAAAPELLAALQGFIELSDNEQLVIEGSCEHDPVLVSARLAIAKAEGRS